MLADAGCSLVAACRRSPRRADHLALVRAHQGAGDGALALVEPPVADETRLVVFERSRHRRGDLLGGARDAPEPNLVDPSPETLRRVLAPTDAKLVHGGVMIVAPSRAVVRLHEPPIDVDAHESRVKLSTFVLASPPLIKEFCCSSLVSLVLQS